MKCEEEIIEIKEKKLDDEEIFLQEDSENETNNETSQQENGERKDLEKSKKNVDNSCSPSEEGSSQIQSNASIDPKIQNKLENLKSKNRISLNTKPYQMGKNKEYSFYLF